MSIEAQPAKTTLFAGGNEADVRRNRFLRFRLIDESGGAAWSRAGAV
ncbi:MAG TPA: hypothetical protein VEH00_12370 [Steroidobacteraceae bacterium]|nr:hypothetical protein [Steroidobacteraceae bacterium]